MTHPLKDWSLRETRGGSPGLRGPGLTISRPRFTIDTVPFDVFVEKFPRGESSLGV